MSLRKPVLQDTVEAYLERSPAPERSAIVPWVFALGGAGVMLIAAFGGSMTPESYRMLMLGGAVFEAIGIAWLAPGAVRKVLSL